jgi:hypothetical protein
VQGSFGARHPVLKVCPEAQLRVQPEAEQLCRVLLDRKRLLAYANNSARRSLKDLSAPTE